MKYWWNLI